MKTFRRATFVIPFLLLVATLLNAYAPDEPGDHILGFWMTKGNAAKVQIYKQNNLYYGKISWAADMYEADGRTLKKDVKNPDKVKRDATIRNLTILKDFQFKDGVWAEGTIYDPLNGKTYSCKMKMQGSKLEIRGYIGVPLFGRTEIWQQLATTKK
jgi:uncharacterized protein (DUF2147 family)